MQHCSRACSVRGLHDVQVAWLQSTMCLVLLAPALSPAEIDVLRRNLRGNRAFGWLSLLNGLSDYVENVGATRCCGRIEPLSFAVLDTLRRCLVILLCGFLIHGNPAGAPQIAGALLTLGGAAWYNLATARVERGRAPPSASAPSPPERRPARPLVAILRQRSRLAGKGG